VPVQPPATGAGAVDASAAADLVPEAPLAGPMMPRPQGRGLTVVVLGPPGVGTTTQASQIGSHYGAAVFSLNDVVQWARSGAGGRALAEQVREFGASRPRTATTTRPLTRSPRSLGRAK